jgi:hypothetical protein
VLPARALTARSLVVEQQLVKQVLVLQVVQFPVARVRHLTFERPIFGKSNFHTLVFIGGLLNPFDVDLLLVVGLIRRPARVFFVGGIIFVFGLFVRLFIIIIIVSVRLAHQVVNDVEPTHDFLHVLVHAARRVIVVIRVRSLPPT